ncbi:MAG: transcriptional repressor NrdR [Planctomycetes bacterium]|nr:transcriptional repressor NrdR [Planctomycetota bacterium]
MRCPFCGQDNDKVVDSRSASEGSVTRRRRECVACGKRYTTYERAEEAPLRVEKRDGTRVAFDREKIIRGILRACEKRPVSAEQIDDMVTSIQNEIDRKFEREVPAAFIGDEVMRHLKDVDQVAYVRFASVYRRFEDVADFAKALGEFSSKPKKSKAN